jgi:hypothetical protein
VFHNTEITGKHKKTGSGFNCIRTSLIKYDILGSDRCVDEDSRILKRYVMSEWYIDTDVSKEDFGLLFTIK